MKSFYEDESIRNKCQKFTPTEYIEIILDLADYKQNLFGKKILENSFGSGRILEAIVKRYIEDCLDRNIDKKLISEGLGNDLYGIELDRNLFREAKNSLNKIIHEYNLPVVKWKLLNKDALFVSYKTKFDYIVGNPPYISYAIIDEETRKLLREKYISCSIGRFDYCYAFIECGINLLNKKGKLVQLVPNNIFKNVFAANLRELLKKHISVIYDFSGYTMFEDTLISTSFLLYDNYNNDNYLIYENRSTKLCTKIHKEDLSGKWQFISKEKNKNRGELIRFGDLFSVSMVIATLLNKAYILSFDEARNKSIEKEVLRQTASPRSLRYKKEEMIIFPYYYCNGTLMKYNKDQFENEFPNAANYLRLFKDKLDCRKSDINVKWFEYGRTQALSHLNQKKLLISTIVTDKPVVYCLDKKTIPYSGIYIIVKKGSELKFAKKIIESEDFLAYVMRIGTSINGKSVRITSNDIENYQFLYEEINWNV